MYIDGATILDAADFVTVTDPDGNVVFQGTPPPGWYEGLVVASLPCDDDEPQAIFAPKLN